MPEDKLPDFPSSTPASQTAEKMARTFFKTELDPASVKKTVRRWLMGIVWSILLIPLIFYLRFGQVTALGWGLTVFFSAYCLLSATGLHFLVRPEYHTPVRLRNDWLDRIGAFWLVACAFGPFFGWLLTSAFPLSVNNWRWFYWGRMALCVGLPVLTALPLLRYVRGQGAPLMLALLLGVTALPAWSAWNTWRDLQSGPVDLPEERLRTGNPSNGEWFLPHTEKRLNGP